MNWSTELKDKMAKLTATQRRAITMVVSAEADGLPINRLLKTTYSCRSCGRVVGRSGDKAQSRRAELESHEASCPNTGWTFAADASSFYGRWRKDADFIDCLNRAREELTNNALSEAARALQLGTAKAVRELLRQILEGERDHDRRSAAIAILDRADLRTSAKSAASDRVTELLSDLRAVA